MKSYRNSSLLSREKVCSYRQQYQSLWSLPSSDNPVVTFEKTPVYLCKYHIAEYLHRIAPWTKVLIILRNPVERAFSNWKLSYQSIPNVKPFEYFVHSEIEHLHSLGLASSGTSYRDYTKTRQTMNLNNTTNSSWFRTIPVPYQVRGDHVLQISAKQNPKKKDKLKCGMITRGFYAEQLVLWMRYFPLNHQLKVVHYESFLKDKKVVFQEVLDFVGAPAFAELDDLDFHISYSPKRPKPPYKGDMPNHIREYLTQFYKPYNDELADLLGEEWRDVWI